MTIENFTIKSSRSCTNIAAVQSLKILSQIEDILCDFEKTHHHHEIDTKRCKNIIKKLSQLSNK